MQPTSMVHAPRMDATCCLSCDCACATDSAVMLKGLAENARNTAAATSRMWLLLLQETTATTEHSSGNGIRNMLIMGS